MHFPKIQIPLPYYNFPHYSNPNPHLFNPRYASNFTSSPSSPTPHSNPILPCLITRISSPIKLTRSLHPSFTINTFKFFNGQIRFELSVAGVSKIPDFHHHAFLHDSSPPSTADSRSRRDLEASIALSFRRAFFQKLHRHIRPTLHLHFRLPKLSAVNRHHSNLDPSPSLSTSKLSPSVAGIVEPFATYCRTTHFVTLSFTVTLSTRIAIYFLC